MSRGANTGKGSWCVMKQPEAPFAKCRLFFFFKLLKKHCSRWKMWHFCLQTIPRRPPGASIRGEGNTSASTIFLCYSLFMSFFGPFSYFPLSSDPSSSLTFPFWSLYHPQRCCSVTTTFNVTTNPIIAVTLRPGRTVPGSGVNVIKQQKKSLP